MMEKIYECIVEGEVPPAADLMLLFSIFAGSSLGWTPSLLEKLNATSEGARAALIAYSRLLSFSGGPQEGAYIFQPRHMNVNMPSNTDDELITSTAVQQDFPLSVPTSMSAFIIRVQGADLCRQVIDALPSILLDSQEPDYGTILELDAKYHDHITSLPVYFQQDQESIEQSRQTCKERPYIPWQRIIIHFSLHTRLCRLHRPYHLEGITNRKYAYSHIVCIRSAHKVLELRRAMDELAPEVGLQAARSWTVMHHVFFAALILAMDVSFNPVAPDAEARKAQVLAAYETLEQSKRESNNLMEGIQRNLQTLMSTLHKKRSQNTLPKDGAAREGLVATSSTGNRSANETGEPVIAHDETTFSAPPFLTDIAGYDLLNDLGQDDWEKLWSEFVAVAPDLDVPQWNSLLEDVDFTPHLKKH
ncbi:hypothetical protein N7486_008458 [Penicillium sp. IBT 16267x]|nr:hypothetical protein N7486_008458 [Penicillium sp. IBT 16267x]